MSKQVFNVNSHVWVKLTPFGLEKLEEEERAFADKYGMVPRPFVPPPVDEHGWSQFQMWDLMGRLGQYLQFAQQNNVFDLGIVIETDDFLQPRTGEELPQ